METIDNESKSRIRSPIDLDNMAKRYKTDNGLYTFTSPSLWTIDKHLFYLLRNSTQKDFESKYKYKPDYMSYDEYGTVVLEYLLMYINGVFSVEDFDLNTIIIPSFDAIVEICQDKFPKQDVDNLEVVSW